jgi:diguanylate cyclase (GGDEF)-like protein
VAEPGERDPLDLSAQSLAFEALAEFAAAPVRSKPAHFASLLEALNRLTGCGIAVALERAANAGGALRVIACAAESQHAGRGASRGSDARAVGVLERALQSGRAEFSNERAAAPYGPEPQLANALALPLRARDVTAGAILLAERPGGWSAANAAALERFARGAGALMLGFQRAALRARAEEDLFRSQLHLRRSAPLDGLTGLPSEQGLASLVADALARANAVALPLAVVALDIDQSKALADRIGAEAFAEVVRRAARTLRETLRPTDLLGRSGEDRFVALLLGCDVDLGTMVAERLRLRVEGASFPTWDGPEVTLTLSAGVASNAVPGEDAAALLARTALLAGEAKRAGRNRVCVERPAREESAGT